MSASQHASLTRRDALAAMLLVLTMRPRRLWADPSPHPAPRRGITAANVATHAQLADTPDAIPVFDLVREIPEVIDGIRCNCGCTSPPEFYSLLSCFEGSDPMAARCLICQGQGRLAHRMHRAGKSLDEIRRGVDARFG
jgi:hypothetical protein